MKTAEEYLKEVSLLDGDNLHDDVDVVLVEDLLEEDGYTNLLMILKSPSNGK